MSEKDSQGKYPKSSRVSDMYAFGIIGWELISGKRYQKELEHPNFDKLSKDPKCKTDGRLIHLLKLCCDRSRDLRPSSFFCSSLLSVIMNDEEHSQVDMFFSHAWEEKDFLHHIPVMLMKLGYRPWVDLGHMKHHLTPSMIEGITKSKVFLACRKYVERKNCRLELESAFNQKKIIIFLIIDEFDKTKGPDWIPEWMIKKYRIREYIYLDLSEIKNKFKWTFNPISTGSDEESQQEEERQLLLWNALKKLFQFLRDYGINPRISSQYLNGYEDKIASLFENLFPAAQTSLSPVRALHKVTMISKDEEKHEEKASTEEEYENLLSPFLLCDDISVSEEFLYALYFRLMTYITYDKHICEENIQRITEKLPIPMVSFLTRKLSSPEIKLKFQNKEDLIQHILKLLEFLDNNTSIAAARKHLTLLQELHKVEDYQIMKRYPRLNYLISSQTNEEDHQTFKQSNCLSTLIKNKEIVGAFLYLLISTVHLLLSILYLREDKCFNGEFYLVMKIFAIISSIFGTLTIFFLSFKSSDLFTYLFTFLWATLSFSSAVIFLGCLQRLVYWGTVTCVTFSSSPNYAFFGPEEYKNITVACIEKRFQVKDSNKFYLYNEIKHDCSAISENNESCECFLRPNMNLILAWVLITPFVSPYVMFVLFFYCSYVVLAFFKIRQILCQLCQSFTQRLYEYSLPYQTIGKKDEEDFIIIL